MLKRFFLTLGFIAGAVMLALAAAGTANAPERLAGSMLKLEIMKDGAKRGVCSAVHIGDNYVLTAAHCTGHGDIVVRTDDGSYEQPGEVLWASKDDEGGYDIALLVSPLRGYAESAPLSCKPLKTGQNVRLDGNPMGWSWISVRGTVAGAQLSVQSWPEVVPLDITGGPGDSGGPVYDEQGNVVGIVVAGYTTPLPVRSFMLAVPSSTICKLLAK